MSLIFFLIPSTNNSNVRIGHSEIIDEHENVTEEIGVEADSSESSTTREFKIYIPGLDSIKNFETLPESKVYQLVNTYLHKNEIDTTGYFGKVLAYVSVKGVQVQQKGSNNFWDELKENYPKVMFFLLPIFALILKLLYYKQKKVYVEFLIFSLHFHCFAFMVASIFQVIYLIVGFDFSIILVLLILFYLIVAMKKVFDKKYLTTVLRFIMFCLLYGICLNLAFVTNLLWTIVMY